MTAAWTNLVGGGQGLYTPYSERRVEGGEIKQIPNTTRVVSVNFSAVEFLGSFLCGCTLVGCTLLN